MTPRRNLNAAAGSGSGDRDRVERPRGRPDDAESSECERASLVARCFAIKHGAPAVALVCVPELGPTRGDEGGDGSGVVAGERERGESDRNDGFVKSERDCAVACCDEGEDVDVLIERGLRDRSSVGWTTATAGVGSIESVEETESSEVWRRGLKWTERVEPDDVVVDEVADLGRVLPVGECLNADFGGDTAATSSEGETGDAVPSSEWRRFHLNPPKKATALGLFVRRYGGSSTVSTLAVSSPSDTSGVKPGSSPSVSGRSVVVVVVVVGTGSMSSSSTRSSSWCTGYPPSV